MHNKKIHNAHHDLILPARTTDTTEERNVNIAVQAKASLNLSDTRTVENQLFVSSRGNGGEEVEHLFWLYLGNAPNEKKSARMLYS